MARTRGIPGGGGDEGFGRGTERVVGMMNQQGTVPDDPEEVRVDPADRSQPGRDDAVERLVFEIVARKRRQGEEAAEVEGPLHPVDLILGGSHLPEEQVEKVRGEIRCNLETHDLAEAAPGQLALHREQEIAAFVLVVDLDVGVASHPERVVGDDLHSRETARRDGRR